MMKFGTGGWREIIADGFGRGAAEVLTGYGFRPYFNNRSSPTPRPHHLPGQGLHRRLEGIPGHLNQQGLVAKYLQQALFLPDNM